MSLINKTPWANGPGNHEASGTTTKAFTQGTNGSKLYFSFDYGDIHFCVIDTNDSALGTRRRRAVQLDRQRPAEHEQTVEDRPVPQDRLCGRRTRRVRRP